MRKKHWGVTPAELIAVLVIVAVMVTIFFPVFQGVRHPPNGAVRDSLGKPIPGAVLRFRDAAGRIITTVTANNYGSFRCDHLDVLSKNAVDGFGLTTAQRRTGASTLYTFAPLGTQTAVFHDEAGKPVAGQAVVFSPAPRTWYHNPNDDAFYQTTDKIGTAQLTQVPSSARLLIQSNDPHYVVEQVQTHVLQNNIQYAVTVAVPSSIVGHVLPPAESLSAGTSHS